MTLSDLMIHMVVLVKRNMGQSPKIYIAGHSGMVGSAILRKLINDGYPKGSIILRSSAELDLVNQKEVKHFFEKEKPDYVYLAAAKVGGIYANDSLPADFIYQNLMIEANIINASFETDVKKLLFLGSSCIYPGKADQPIKESSFMTGSLEKTNEWYAIAKIAGIKLCQAYRKQYGSNFISVMPTNLYGQGDNFHPQYSHVPAALLRRFHEAKINDEPKSVVWGTGNAKREFLHVDDLADACVFLMQNYSEAEPINVGTGSDLTISEFAQILSDVVEYKGMLEFDSTRPDGTMRKVLDISRLKELGWQAKIPLSDGLNQYYSWFLENQESIRI